MPPTPFHPTHTTPFKSSLSSSQQPRKHEHVSTSIESTGDEWPVALDAQHLDARQWTYLAEGGKNLLLRYVGPDASPYVLPDGRRMALRMGKVPRAKKGESSSKATVDVSSSSREAEIDPVEWQETILRQDLDGVEGSSASLLPPLLRVTDAQGTLRSFLRLVVAKIEGLRPIERRIASGVDENETKDVFTTEDLSAPVPQRPCLIFEIKPKCGFLPHPSTLTEHTAQHKCAHSRFRMHSVHRNERNIDQHSFKKLYDPLDLYSNDAERIDVAAEALYLAWSESKGNNLRIFLDGKKVDRTVSEGAEGGAFATAQELARSLWPDEQLDVRATLTRLLRMPSVQDVLSRLKTLQQRYDPIDVEGVDVMCRSERGKGLDVLDDEPEITLEEYKAITHKLCQGNESGRTTFSSTRDAIIALLLSTMYKDCSLFLRISSGDSAPQIGIHLVDLDPKPTHKVPNLLKLDQDIVETFAEWTKTNLS